jgi:DNA-binding SARP family transcriptional activator
VAAPCRIRLLGGFDVEVGGRPLTPAAWRPDASLLVKALALEPAHHLQRREVLDRVWPLLAPHEAEPLLKRALKDVCKAMLDGRAITVEGEKLRLWPYGELWVDALTFAAKAKHARDDAQRREATALYRGDLLPGDELPGLAALRTRLRLMHLELLRDPHSGTPAWVDLREPVFSAAI